MLPGSYVSEVDEGGDETLRAGESQACLSHVAARALIFIDYDDPAPGPVRFIGVGMGEVSSRVIGPEITPGHYPAKGDELGYSSSVDQPTACYFAGASSPISLSAPSRTSMKARRRRYCGGGGGETGFGMLIQSAFLRLTSVGT